jgi:diguanylate cyclase (GGDEF)-like protein
MTITPVPDEHGAIQHFIAVKQDIAARKQMEEELHQLATTDSLTGVANRRHFLLRLGEELRRIRRYGGHCALIMLDLDRFKRINDTWGHAAGDRVLCHFTSLVRDHLRGSDLLGRLGGEEFAVYLPETGLEGAMGFAERVRRHTESEPAESEKGPIAYAVSAGVTLLDPLDAAPEDALARADEALYRAKALGRNRVERWVAEDRTDVEAHPQA